MNRFDRVDFDNQKWSTDKGYLKFIEDVVGSAGQFKREASYEMGLDLGCGTGIITNILSRYCEVTVGVDINRNMIDCAWSKISEGSPYIIYTMQDINNMYFPNEQFDVITARNILRYVDRPDKLIDECRRMMFPGGSIFIMEGVPPTEECIEPYKEVFDIKGRRNIFTTDDLIQLVARKFRHLTTYQYDIKDQCISKWLDKDGNLTEDDKLMIMDIHRTMDWRQKRDYNYKEIDGEIYIDFTNVVISAHW